MGLELLWKSTKLSMVNGKGRIIVIIAIIVDWVDPRKPNKKIQTDLDFGCWVSLSLRIERFSLTYLFAQTNLRNYKTTVKSAKPASPFHKQPYYSVGGII
jgi:hypothetical protein